MKLNIAQTYVKYILFMTFFFVFFLSVSFILLPIAWIFGILDKAIKKKEEEQITNPYVDLLVFCFFGPVILLLDLFADAYYFWANNFRTGLNKIVVQHDKSSITNHTLKMVTLSCRHFADNKIKSTSTQ